MTVRSDDGNGVEKGLFLQPQRLSSAARGFSRVRWNDLLARYFSEGYFLARREEVNLIFRKPV